jgi:hypothetical protein
MKVTKKNFSNEETKEKAVIDVEEILDMGTERQQLLNDSIDIL